MKKEIVSQSTSPKPARRMRGALRPVATLIAVFALIACASSSALTAQCEPVEFEEGGGPYPQTIYVYATTPTTGATILATMAIGYIPANPTHSNCSPTGTTFIYSGPFTIFAGQYKRFKAIACMADSAMTSYEVDNSGD